jgi:hypothetical protein
VTHPYDSTTTYDSSVTYDDSGSGSSSAGYDAGITYDDTGTTYDGLGPGPPPAVVNAMPAVAATRELARVRHIIRGPGGSDSPVVGQDWSADEEGPGGYWSASAWVSADRVYALPNVYRNGAVWTMYTDSPDDPLWEGNLLDQIESQDGRVQLLGRGWGQIPDRSCGRLLYMSRDYTDWVVADGDPHNHNNQDNINPDVQPGRIRFAVAPSTTLSDGDQAMVCFWAEGAVLGHINFEIDSFPTVSGGASAWSLRVWSAVGPHLGSAQTEGGIFNNGDVGTGDIGRDLNHNNTTPDLVALQFIRNGNLGSPGTTTQAVGVIDHIYVRAAGVGKEEPTNFVVSDICTRLGISDWDVASSGDQILPLDFKSGTFADALDYCSNYTGWPWLVLSRASQTYMRFRQPDTFYTTRSEGLTQLDPVTRYNQVTVRYETVSGRQREYTQNCSDLDIPDPYAGTNLVQTMTIELSLPGRHPRHHIKHHRHIDASVASTVAARVLRLISKERYYGHLERAWVHDPSGRIIDARQIHAGDYIDIIDAKPYDDAKVQVISMTSTADGASFDLAQHDPVLDRYFLKHKLTEM